ncbi:uncharacterized protein LOC62_03G004013 [Vanrija pseudolonga]|uniref:Dystroglycan-type cadherin-like domain-containing protein n=1 Tax=Vanrija pseudolonga TaxID=143232 RepID=A0AAF0Y9Y0_9TREE|nr:hypothetical protein LOC62_03G004013 [Vanrija pseudolonga]
MSSPPAPMLALVALALLLPAQAAFTTTLWFNYTLDAVSPLLTFYPPESAASPTRWTTSWTNASWSSPLRVGVGSAYRWIEGDALLEHASVSWRFPATAFYVRGAAGDPADSVLVNGTPTPLNVAATGVGNDTDPASILPSLVDMPWAASNVTYYAPGGILIVDGVTLTTGIMSDAAHWEDISPNMTTLEQQLGGNNSITSGQAINVTIPASTAFVALNGSVSPSGGTLLASLDPAPPAWISTDPTARLSTKNPWQANTTLFASILDPGVSYVLRLSAEDGAVALSTISYYAGNANVKGGTALNATPSIVPEPPTTSAPGASGGAHKANKSNAGAIAGGVVGGVLGLALLAALAFFLVRRRRRSTPPSERSEKMLVDDVHPPEETPVSPFIDTKITSADYLGAKGSLGAGADAAGAGTGARASPTESTDGSWAAGTLSAISRARPSSTTAPESPMSSPLDPELDAGPVLERPPPTYNPAWEGQGQPGPSGSGSGAPEVLAPAPAEGEGKNVRALPTPPGLEEARKRSYNDMKAALLGKQ